MDCAFVATRFLGSYGDILRHRGAPRFVIAGWLGRMSRSTSGISTILLVAGVTGSYGLAGAVAGAIVFGIALGGPLWARAVDSRGQLRVLPWALAALTLAASALVTVVLTGAPQWLWFVCAFLLGASAIDTGSLARARWVALLPEREKRHTALALETVNDELVFVIGPPLATIVAGLLSPVFGFAMGIAIALVGGVGLLLARSTSPEVLTRAINRSRGWLPRGVLAVVPLYLGVGVVFGSIDVSAIGIGTALGNTALSGIILAVFATGSVVSGLAFGPLSAHWPPTRRVWLSALLYVLVVPLVAFSTHATVLAIAIFAAGLATTPVLIAGSSLIETRVERDRLTEAMAWPSVGLAAGVIVGSTLTGIVIDNGTAFDGLGVAVIGAVAVGVLGVVCALVTRPRAGEPELRRPATVI